MSQKRIIYQFIKLNPYLSVSEIAKRTGILPLSVVRWMRELRHSKKITSVGWMNWIVIEDETNRIWNFDWDLNRNNEELKN